MDTWSKMYYDSRGIKKENINEKLLLKHQLNVIIDKLDSIDAKINNTKNTEINKYLICSRLISKVWNKMYTACATYYYQYKK